MSDFYNVRPTLEFPIVVEEFDLKEIGRKGSGTIKVKVLGYWSTDVITIYVNRDFVWQEKSAKWVCSISHSSGGRDTKEVASDLDASTNFGCALIKASNIGREILFDQDKLEAAYQERMAEIRAESERKEAEEQAALDADPAMTKKQATALLALASKVIAPNAKMCVRFIARGNLGPEEVFKITRGVNNRSFYYQGVRVSYDAMVEILTKKASHTNATDVLNLAD